MAVISLESHHYHSVTTTTTTSTSSNHDKNPAISKRKRQSNKHNKSTIDAGELSDSSSSFSSRSTQSQRRQRSPQQQQRRSNHNKNGRRPTKKSNAKKTTPKSPPPMTAEQEAQFWALDCEMVGVGDYGGIDSILARVVIVDWYGQVVLDQYVQPTQPVTDYRTHVSGITADQLLAENGAVPWKTCHDTILELLHISTSSDAEGWLDYSQTTQILVGHGLKNDLAVLGLPGYPWYLQRDTTKWEPFLQSTTAATTTACRGLPGSPRKLRDLTKCKLHRDIQVPGRPHCPHEDAVAALDLYKLVRVKWEKAMDYKLNKTREIMLLQQRQQAPQEAQEATAQERPHETRVDDEDKEPCDAVPLLQYER